MAISHAILSEFSDTLAGNDAREYFGAHGIPTRRNEAYHFTDLARGLENIEKPNGEIIICNGNFQQFCYQTLGLRKTVFQQLRDEGQVCPKSNDEKLLARQTISEFNQNVKLCAKQRIEFAGWKSRKVL